MIVRNNDLLTWVGPGIEVSLVPRYDLGQAVDALPGGHKGKRSRLRVLHKQKFLDALLNKRLLKSINRLPEESSHRKKPSSVDSDASLLHSAVSLGVRWAAIMWKSSARRASPWAS